MNPDRSRRLGTVRGGLGAAMLAGLAACAPSPEVARGTRAVSATDFAGEAANPPADPGAPAAAAPIVVRTAREASGGISDVVVVAGSPAGASAAADAAPAPVPGAGAGKTYFVDQMVGQINGRPVYATEFFAPMDARLRQDAARMKEREWLVSTRKLIQQALADRLRDDLLLAEFQSTLTPEQRVGVLGFITNVREGLISGNLGSETLANQRLRETEGLSLDEKVKDITERRFIVEQLRKAIGSRVQVSYRDIELYYEQHRDQFTPPATAVFRIVAAPRADAERIARIEQALAAGEDFAAVAKRESVWRPAEENTQKVLLRARAAPGDAAADAAGAAEGGEGAVRYFGPDALNDAAKALSPGQATGRIDAGPSAYWLKLERIDRPPGQSLYEAQLEIERRLYVEREEEERLRYFEGLLARGSFSDVQTMIERLLVFAAKKYLGAGREAEARKVLSAPAAPAE